MNRGIESRYYTFRKLGLLSKCSPSRNFPCSIFHYFQPNGAVSIATHFQPYLVFDRLMHLEEPKTTLSIMETHKKKKNVLMQLPTLKLLSCNECTP